MARAQRQTGLAAIGAEAGVGVGIGKGNGNGNGVGGSWEVKWKVQKHM